ncbi:carboxypeptidase-like regulatory domain-containing protein [Capnocytophaga sp. oral taxon 878]|uniref:carboxypeptidase-like regulatory domain-containing protein n=1 Tax=Capnocytophaga sp. oral taxon 878 TaxID=1316596 RepID=UPI000D027AC3|nr:carboxypeptidase-like regulatory domain-containing protein [Capnocytophaga sp. oral taxon 878]AVM49044.1 hypothetical protein C4H12_00365 [Capnocytophaga sp. oral taxon 878]
MTKLLLSLLLLLIELPLKAQNRIVNSNHQSVEYVNIGIVGTNKGIISDENGNFSLESLGAKPTDSIYFSHLSYKHRVLAYRDIKKEVQLTESVIQLPTTTLKVKKPKVRNVKSPGATTFITLYGEMKSHFQQKGGILSELGDFITLSNDTQLTEFSIEVNESSFYMVVLRVVAYQTDKEHKTFTPLIKEPIYIELFSTNKPQVFTHKLSVLAPKGELWVGVQFVEMRGKDEAKLTFNATTNTCWLRFPDNTIRKVNSALGIPFTVKGYDIIKLAD